MIRSPLGEKAFGTQNTGYHRKNKAPIGPSSQTISPRTPCRDTDGTTRGYKTSSRCGEPSTRLGDFSPPGSGKSRTRPVMSNTPHSPARRAATRSRPTRSRATRSRATHRAVPPATAVLTGSPAPRVAGTCQSQPRSASRTAQRYLRPGRLRRTGPGRSGCQGSRQTHRR